MKKIAVLALGLFLTVVAATAGASASSQKTARCIRDPECHSVFVVAHRANGFGAPENSEEAVRKAVGAGVHVIEVDVRKSRDGYLYAIHDKALDRTTNLNGAIAKKASVDLGDAMLENGDILPMLQDLYDITNGKAVLNLDFKVDAVSEVAEWVSRAGSFDDFIFFVDNLAEIKTAARAKAKYPKMIVMARLKSSILLETIKQTYGAMPEIIHTDFPDEEVIRWIHSEGAKAYANSLGSERLPWPISSIAAHLLKVSGVDFIQTDQTPHWLKKIKKEKCAQENLKAATPY